MRNWVLAGSVTALIALPTVLAFFSGGFFDEPRIIAATLVWILVVIAAILTPRPLPVSTPGRLAVAGLCLLCLWTAASITWAPLGGRAQDDLQRLLLYTGYFISAVALLRGAGVRRAIEPALVLGAFVVVAYGLSERLLPDLVELEQSTTSDGRLEQPLTYWNAFGIVAGIGLILAVRLAGDPERTTGVRMAAAGVAVPLGLGVYLTFARGVLAAVAVGLVLLVALAPALRVQLRSALVVVGAAALASLVANNLTTVKSLGERDAGEGLLMLAALVLLALTAAIVTVRPSAGAVQVPALPTARPAAIVGTGVIVLVIGGLVFAAFEGRPEGASPASGATAARLGSIDSNRYRYWEVAGTTFSEHPIQGAGSGGFAVDWLKLEDRADAAVDAHSLYLETAAELGFVGLLFLLAFMGGVAAAGVKLYRLDPRAAAGPAAALAAWALHAGLDWDWEMPAVTLPALILAAALVAWSEEVVRHA